MGMSSVSCFFAVMTGVWLKVVDAYGALNDCCAKASFSRMSLLEGTLLSFICRLKSLSHSIVSFDDS